MIVISAFIICLILFNALSMLAGRFVERPSSLPGLGCYFVLLAIVYPRSHEFKRAFEDDHSYGRRGRVFTEIGSMITDRANIWDWIAAGATGAILVYGLFAYLKSTESYGYSAGGVYNDGFELELKDILQLFFWGVVAVLALYAIYCMFW